MIGGLGLVVVIALIAAVLSGGDSDPAPTTLAPDAAADAVRRVTGVDPAALDAVGVGTVNGPAAVVQGTPLRVDGKPEVLYIGAEFCPFCAAQRWGLIVALSRFGTFDGLEVSRSSSTDVFPDTPTFTFHGSSFTSDVVAFTAVETATNEPDGNGGYQPLDTPTPEQIAVVQELNPQGGIPFIDFAGEFAISGASFDPEVLQGKSAAEVAAELTDPSSPVAASVLGTANMMTATICQLTGGQPVAVCTSPAVQAFAAQGG